MKYVKLPLIASALFLGALILFYSVGVFEMREVKWLVFALGLGLVIECMICGWGKAQKKEYLQLGIMLFILALFYVAIIIYEHTNKGVR